MIAALTDVGLRVVVENKKSASRTKKTPPKAVTTPSFKVAVIALPDATAGDGIVALLEKIAPEADVQTDPKTARVPCVVAIEMFDDAVLRGVKSGLSVADAAAAWGAAIDASASVFRRKSKKLLFMDQADATHAPEACADRIADTLGLDVSKAGLKSDTVATVSAEDALVLMQARVLADAAQEARFAMVAAQLARPHEAPSLADLAALVSTALRTNTSAQKDDGTDGAATRPDMSKLEDALLRNREKRSEEISLLTNALIQSQAQLEHREAQEGLAQTRLAAAQHTVTNLKQRRSEREEVLAAAFLEQGLQLDEQTKELAAAYEERNVLSERVTAIRAEVSAAQGELDRVYGSRSWKITGPLRKIKNFTGRI